MPQTRIQAHQERARWRTAGLCISCGKQRDEVFLQCARCRAARRLSYQKHSKKWRKTEAPEIAARTKAWKFKLKLRVFGAYGGKCVCCGEKELIFLSIDHVNNDGARHRKEVASGQLYRWLEKNNFPPNFQILCFNCNRAKYVNGGLCPHKRGILAGINTDSILHVPSVSKPKVLYM